MSKTIFPQSIKSRPVYATLEPRPGKAHVVIADGEGADALGDLLDKAPDRAGMLAALHILYTPGPNGTDLWAKVQGFGAAQTYRAPTIPAMLPRLSKVVSEAHMGTQFYVTGTEINTPDIFHREIIEINLIQFYVVSVLNEQLVTRDLKM
jgi:hypothetical protein